MSIEIRPIAHIESEYKELDEIPRQSGMNNNISRIVFMPEFRNPGFFKGIKEGEDILLLWFFSENIGKGYKMELIPGGKKEGDKKGLFATRTPYRPNPIALSTVKVHKILNKSDEVQLLVCGADLLDGTPIIDIKPVIK